MRTGMWMFILAVHLHYPFYNWTCCHNERTIASCTVLVPQVVNIQYIYVTRIMRAAAESGKFAAGGLVNQSLSTGGATGGLMALAVALLQALVIIVLAHWAPATIPVLERSSKWGSPLILCALQLTSLLKLNSNYSNNDSQTKLFYYYIAYCL